MTTHFSVITIQRPSETWTTPHTYRTPLDLGGEDFEANSVQAYDKVLTEALADSGWDNASAYDYRDLVVLHWSLTPMWPTRRNL